jgi:undecaprenyl-diphosphatase
MGRTELLVGILADAVQGIVEWLPVSSQGNLALFLTAAGTDPDVALQLALFLQLGTTLSAATYYREDIARALQRVPGWRPGKAYDEENALISYLLVACAMTALVGIPLYVFAVDLAGELGGAVFAGMIGALLVLTGLARLTAEFTRAGDRQQPTLVDSVLVGAVQGVAILPGVSRSGVTSSALLVRRYQPTDAFRLSFLLSIPASVGAAALTVVGAGGLPGFSPESAAAALIVSALIGYLAIGALVWVAERVSSPAVCFVLGGLALLGGLAVAVLPA